ncbi:MAG: YbhB/YbcL family Raf kinase inhibitor-like protein [Persephonella sp.]|nr:YbhB/YbcL family Raf kinase inhibitor-like protein [Persephonella sp.]
MIVKSPIIQYGETIPKIYTCDGSDISPPVSWSGYPQETQSFVLIMDDPDAPMGVFTHWIAYDIPAGTNELPEDFPQLPEVDGIKQGINDFGRIGYGGPCPPFGKLHRYFFRVFALYVPSLELPSGASRQEVELVMTGKIIDKGYLMGLYGR